MPDEINRYLILVYLDEADVDRLRYVAPRLHDSLERMSVDKDDYLLAFHTPDRETLAYLLRTKLVAPQIRSRLTDSPDHFLSSEMKERDVTPILGHEDEILVFELGADFDTPNAGRVDAWLRHHL